MIDFYILDDSLAETWVAQVDIMTLAEYIGCAHCLTIEQVAYQVAGFIADTTGFPAAWSFAGSPMHHRILPRQEESQDPFVMIEADAPAVEGEVPF